jgi:hypothetical protein
MHMDKDCHKNVNKISDMLKQMETMMRSEFGVWYIQFEFMRVHC